jgi:hypothetical protein
MVLASDLYNQGHLSLPRLAIREGYHYPIFLLTRIPELIPQTHSFAARNILDPSSEYMQYYFLNHEILQERL